MDYGYCALTLFWGTFLRSLSPSHSGPNVESVQWVDDWNNEYTGLEATPDHWCDYKGQLYPPGPVQLPGCVSCQCHGETGQMECGMTVCPSVPDCIRWDNSTQHCCPDCLERGCFLDDKPYPLGRRIPTGPCKVCYCPWSGHGQGEPDCIDLTCAAPPCVDSQVPEGKCCPICPRGPNCWLGELVIPAGREVWIAPCRSCICPAEEEMPVKGTAPVHGRHATCRWHENCFG